MKTVGDVCVVSPDETAGAVLAALQAARQPVAVIADAKGKAVGSITDTDLRLAALAEALDRPVADVAPEGLVAVPPDAADEEVDALAREHRLPSLPVVDRGGKAVGMRAAPNLFDVDPVAVIMAGGRGQRLRPLTDKVPKPLLKVGRSSIVERIVAALVDAGIADVHLSVNYKAEVFHRRLGDGSKLGVTLHYLRERRRMGTAGALSLLPERPSGPILVTNGDILTRLDFARLLEFHWRRGAAATIGAVEHVTPIPYGVLRTDADRLVALEEKPQVRVRCNAGFYVLEPAVLDLLDPEEPLDMPDLLQRALDGGLGVHVFPVLERWFDIGSPEDFQHVLMEFATGEEE